MTKKYSLKATNSDSETCEKCGKTGLKKVMWLDALDDEGNETGSTIAMGTTCGAKALGLNGEFNSIGQVVKANELSQEKEKTIVRAKEMATEFNDEIAIIRAGNSYTTVRGKAFDANPNRYGMPVQWVS